MKNTNLFIIVVVGICVVLILPLVYWFKNPELSGMQIFLKCWYVYVVCFVLYISAALIYWKSNGL